MKKLILTTIAMISCVTLCGCADVTEIGDRAIVQLAAVDYEDGEYNLNILLFNAGGSGGEIDSTQPNVIKVQGSGRDITKAVRALSLVDGKDIYMSESKLLVLGGGFATADVMPLLDTLYKDMKCSLNMPVCYADKAELLTDIQFTEGITSAEKPYAMIQNAERLGELRRETLLTLMKNTLGGRESKLPYFVEGKNGSGMSTDEDGRTILLNGTKSLVNGRIVR